MNRLRGEDGIALTVAIMSLALMIMLGGVALRQAVSALRHTTTETNVKRALQAADAGIEDATFAVARADIGNTLDIDLLNPTSVINQNCVISGSVAGLDLQTLDPLTPPSPSGRRWCPETSAQTTSDGGTYTYRISELVRAGAGACGAGSALNLDREVVAVGRSNGQVRRVKARLNASLALLSGAAVQASGTGNSPAALTLSGSATILGNAESNGSIRGTGLTVVSGNAVPGPGGNVNGVLAGGSSATSACQLFTIPEVQPPTSVSNPATSIDTAGCYGLTFLPVLCTLFPGSASYTDTSASPRTLTVTGTGRARLTTGGTYRFCRIVMNGGTLVVPSGAANTQIFLDDPDQCRNSSGTIVPGAGTISVSGGARIVNCHLPTRPESLQIYAVGNPTIPTTQTLAPDALSVTGLTNLCGTAASGLGVPMTLIAPHSTIQLQSSANIAGQVAGEVVTMSSLARVSPVNALVNISRLGSNPVLPLYKASQYRECTGRTFAQLPATDPAQGC